MIQRAWATGKNPWRSIRAAVLIAVCFSLVAACGQAKSTLTRSGPALPGRYKIVARHFKVFLTPPFRLGWSGWCLVMRRGSCGQPVTHTGPVVALEPGEVEKRRWMVIAVLTGEEVAAISVDHSRPIVTRTDPGLPGGLRVAFYEIVGENTLTRDVLKRERPKAIRRLTRVIALDAEGKPIGPPREYNVSLLEGRQRLLRPARVGSREWKKPGFEPAGDCKIQARASSVTVLGGAVASRLPTVSPGPVGEELMGCAEEEYIVRKWPAHAIVLVDAAHPGVTPPPLPAMTAVPGHPGVFAAPTAGTEYSDELVARRVRGGWLVVTGERSQRERVALLDELQAEVRI